jgi:hypothetical protein
MSLAVLFLFFRNFIWITTSITLFECYLFAISDDVQVIMMLFWTKLVSDLLIGLLFLLLQPRALFFFHNLGYTRVKLFGSALAFDLSMWALFISGTSLIS